MIRVCFTDGRPSKWIEDTEMKTAEEVAEEILSKASLSDPFLKRARLPILVNALTAYAEERVNEDRDKRTVDDLYKRSRKIGRAEALEEVRRDIGKMLDTFPLDPKIAAIAINIKKILDALKDKA